MTHFLSSTIRLLILLSVILFSCKKANNPKGEKLFTRLKPEETGISFINTNREDDAQNILTYEYFYNGGGVALGDINNDGLVDIYFSSNQGENKLYLNKGNFVFEDITQRAGVSAKNGWKTGVSLVDINADGYLDISVCRSGNQHPFFRENSLFINNRNLTFADRAEEYGLNDDSFSTQTAFLDYDRDGDLDVFLLNHSHLSISNSFDITKRNTKERTRYVGNRFYKNNNGHFAEVSDSVGVFGPASNYGLGIVYSDLNNDGWLDIYTSNDYTGKDKLLLNNRGIFDEESDSLLTQMSQFTMGVDVADINNDGNMDIVTLDMLPESNKRQKELFWPDRYDLYASMVKNGLHHQYMRNMLHLNNANGSFSEIGQLAGISNTDWSWSALFADYDNDGFQDLFVSNGFKREFINYDFLKYKSDLEMKAREGKPIDKMSKILSEIPSNKVHNYMFRNADGISFTNESESWGFEEENLTNGTAYADLDNDGDLDLVTNNMNEVAGIYRNNSEHFWKNNFLKLKLHGADQNTFGLGATITVYCQGKLMKRTLCPYRGFQSSVEPSLFFGLGKSAKIDSLTVVWPKGEIQKIEDVKINQSLTLFQKDATNMAKGHGPQLPPKWFKEKTNAINFKHTENDFIDFKIQPLLPRSYSTSGPAMAQADANNDGLLDLYFGGAKGQAGSIFLQNKKGDYIEKVQRIFLQDAKSEDVDAIFFDMDNDGDQDLYVVSGGYEFDAEDSALEDHLYKNDGKGNFSKRELPLFYSSGSCARSADIDQDGDLDLFIGGRIVPGRYPEIPTSYILLNDGRGNFSIGTAEVASSLARIGLVTDACWLDLNKDSLPDLIVVGEWMPITIYINRAGHLINETNKFIKEKTNGWWNCLIAEDFDGDGDKDFIAGNYGRNNQFKPSLAKPVRLYYSDYDNNGSVDPLMTYYIGNKSYPSPTRDELTDQVPSFKKRFRDYASYASATIETVLLPEELRMSAGFVAYNFETSYFQNNNGSFSITPLPVEAQFSPIFCVTSMDINGDGKLDIITAGNLSKMSARFGKATGSFGTVFVSKGNGKFEHLPARTSGICIKGDVRKILDEKNRVVFAINNERPIIYEVK